MKYLPIVPISLCLSLILTTSVLAGAAGGRRLFKFQSKSDFASFQFNGARWDEAVSGVVFHPESAKRKEAGIPYGLVESPYVEIGLPCDEIVVSWNAETPPGTYLTIYIQARAGGFWGRKFTAAIWNRDNRPVTRMSIKGQKDDTASLHTDILRLKKPADAFRVSAKLSSIDGNQYPILRLLTVHTLDSDAGPARQKAHKAVWGKDLPVPERSQLTIPEGHRFCSATSTAMVLDYWSEKLDRPELTVKLEGAVAGIYDKGWGGTGNWTFNTAYAAEFGGLQAYVTRLGSLSQIEKWIEKDVPVIVSIDYNILRNRQNAGRSGHLMVLRGFTPDGDCIINDPATNLDKGQKVCRIYDRGDFERSWLTEKGSLGTVYLIYPDGWDIPRNEYLNW